MGEVEEGKEGKMVMEKIKYKPKKIIDQMTAIGISSTEQHDAMPMSILRGSSGLREHLFL